MLERTVEQALELERADPSLAIVAPALLVKNGHYPVLNVGVHLDTGSVCGLFGNLPAHVRMCLVPHIVRGPLFWIPKHVMCFDDKIKERAVAGLRIIGMVAGRQMTKHPLDCGCVGFSA